MSTIRKKWKRYLCMIMTMILLTTSIGGCGFFGNQNASVNSDVMEEGTEDKDGEESGSSQETKDPEAEGEDTDLVDVSADWSVFWYVDEDSIQTQQEILEGLEDCQGVQILLGGNTDSPRYVFENGTGYEVEHAQGTDVEAFLEQSIDQYVGDRVIFIYSADTNSALSGSDFAQQLSDAFGTDEENQPIDLLVLDTKTSHTNKVC